MAAVAAPRRWLGMNSAMAEVTAEYSPPTPIAVMNRNSKNTANVGENALTTVVIEYITKVATKSRLRP